MIIKNWKKEIFTIPNILSIFRILLIPIYVVIYLQAETTTDYYLAAAILAVSCLTDLIDGKIARHFNMISTVGKVLDPIADKATQFTLIICLAIKHPVLLYLVPLFVAKECFQLIAMTISYKNGKVLKGALFSGKVCTTVLFASLILMVMLPQMSEKVINIIVLVDGIMMLIAFFDYIIAYFARDSKFVHYDVSDNEDKTD